jgi:RNase P protein component
VVPKFGFTIVRRNKLKRRLRELARQPRGPRAAPCDVLLRARRDAYAGVFGYLER